MAYTLLLLLVFQTPTPEPLLQKPAPALRVHAGGVEKATYLGWQGNHPLGSGKLDAEEWIAWRWDRAMTLEGEWKLSLVNGSQLRGQPIGGTADFLNWQGSIPGVTPVRVNLLEVREIKRTAVSLAPSLQDQLVLQTPQGNRDRHQGWLLAVDEPGVLFEEVGGANHYSWAQIQHLSLHLEGASVSSQHPWISFSDGSVLRAEILDSGREFLKLRLGVDGVVKIPLTSVVRIRRGDQQIVDLSQRPWSHAVWVKDTTIPRGPQRNLSVEGRPMRVSGQVWPHGIGVFGPTSLSFRLEKPGILFFQVGIDDETNGFHRRQAVTLRIRHQSDILWEETWTPEKAPMPQLISIPKPGVLHLEVLSKGSGGHVDWLDPVIWIPPVTSHLD